MESIKVEVTEIIKTLNARVTLPADLSIIFSSEKAAGAGPAYSPNVFTGVKAGGESGRLITYPYEFIVRSRDILARSGLSGSKLVEATTATTAFVLVHEASHALIDLLELPVLGREEDAADSGAAVFLSSLDNGAELIHYAVTFWRNLSQLRGVEANAFADEHGLDLQRAYNLMCWSYGQDMNKNEILEHELPPNRSARCAYEYQKLAKSWDKLLKASLKPKC